MENSMKYDTNARMNDNKIFEDGLTAVFSGKAQRKCICAKCNRPIFSGQNRLTACYERQPKGQHFHPLCFATVGKTEANFASDGHDNETVSACRTVHEMRIFAKKWDFGYLTSLGFQFCGIYYRKTIENGYSEKVVEAVLKSGYTVTVNGVKVETADEYRKMTLK